MGKSDAGTAGEISLPCPLEVTVLQLAIRHDGPLLKLSGSKGCGTFETVIPFFFFLFGIVIGSFLNVCISRIPEGLSVVTPGSRCPRCEKPIRPYDNIPILSWFLLRGKCRNCHLPISPMYPAVELLTGLMFVLTYYAFGVTIPTFKFLVFGCLLIILIVTDIVARILPDAVNWFGFGIGLAFAVKISPSSWWGFGSPSFWIHDRYVPPVVVSLADALLGAALGSLLLLGAASLYKLVRKREGMGMGDVKMMAMVGTFLGVRGTFLTILVGTCLGSIVGILWVLGLYLAGWNRNLAVRGARRGLGSENVLRWAIASQYQLPLGTFLGAGAFLVVYWLPWALSRVPI
jgi:leader peptidase (prepilin peptidase)/N-methyltransferase